MSENGQTPRGRPFRWQRFLYGAIGLAMIAMLGMTLLQIGVNGNRLGTDRLFWQLAGVCLALGGLAGWSLDRVIRWYQQAIGASRMPSAAVRPEVTDVESSLLSAQDSEQRFWSMVQSSPMGMHFYALNEQGHLILVDANSAADRMTGVNNQELVGRRIEEAFPALVNTEIPAHYKAVAQDGHPWRMSTFDYEDERIRGAYDVHAFQTTPGCMAVMFLEVTDLQRAQAELAESRNMLRLVLDTIPVRVFWKDRESRYVGCNLAFARDAQESHPDNVIGRGDDDFTWCDHAESYRDADRSIIATGIAKLGYEGQQREDGGHSRWLRASKIPLRNSRDEVIGVLGCYEDISEQKQAERALRESEARFRRLAENAQDMIYRMSLPDGLYQYISPAAEEITGYAPQAWYDNPSLIEKIIHPDWRDYFREEWENLLQGKMALTYEYQIVDKEGRNRWIYQRNVLVRDADGAPIAIEGIATDITYRRQAEDEMTKARALLTTAIEQTPAGIVIADAPDGRIRLVNSAALGIRGGKLESLVDIRMEDHPLQWKTYYPDGRLYEPDKLPLSRAILTGEVISNEEVVIEKPDGQRRWVLANAAPVRDPEGTIVAGIVVFPDVTEQKMANRRLSFTQFTVDQAKIAVFWCHDDGRFFYVNETACRWLHYDRDELMQMHVTDINPELSREAWHEHWREIKEKGLVRLESVHQRKNGDVYPVEIHSNYVRHEGDEYQLAFVHDISERRQAEEALAEYRSHLEDLVQHRTAELKTANRELASFAYSVSHDLRSPLRSMNGFSQALLEDYQGQLDDVGRDYLQRIRRAATHMDQLIDDLLGLSRLARSTMQYQQVNLSEMAQRLIDRHQQQEPKRRAEITIAKGIVACGDPGLLEIVLQNLLGNAWKFTGRCEVARISFGIQPGEGERVFLVRDNGAGFDMAYAEKLFGVFQRLHGRQEFEGTGIGLATVQRIIHRHGGRIWAEAEVDCGATFFFTLADTTDRMEPV